MGTQNLLHRYQVQLKVSPPSTSAPEGTKISDDFLETLLHHYAKLGEEDAVEFSGIDLHGVSLRGSETAEIAAFWETETQAEPLKLPKNLTTVESAVSYIFQKVALWHNGEPWNGLSYPAPSEPKGLRIFTLDWKGLRMVLVAFERNYLNRELAASFTTTGSGACDNGQEEDATRRENAAAYLSSYFDIQISPHHHHHDNDVQRYVGQRLNAFFNRQGDAGEAHSSNENLKTDQENGIADAAGPRSITKLFATRRAAELGKVRMESKGLLVERLSVKAGKMFRCITYQVDGKGGFAIIIRSQAPQDPSEVNLKAEASVGRAGCEQQCGIEKLFRGRLYVHQRNDPAHNRILTDIKSSHAVRRWFLSSLIKGDILVNKNSTADSFIPSQVKRATEGGILLNKPFPASYFSVLGGDLVSIGDYMFFRRYWTDDDPLIVKGIQGRLLILGEDKTESITESVSTVDWAYYWSLNGWKVGPKRLESAPSSLLEEVIRKVDAQGAAISRIEKRLMMQAEIGVTPPDTDSSASTERVSSDNGQGP